MIERTATGNRLGRFETPASDPPMQFIFSCSLDYEKELSRACVTMLASEEKPCNQLSLVCYLQNSIEPLNKQEELLSGCSICIRACSQVNTHTSTQRTKQTHHLLLSTIHTQPGNGYVHSTHHISCQACDF